MPVWLATEVVAMIEAPCCRCGMACLMASHGPFTLIENCRSKSSTLCSSHGEKSAIPAFRNSTSIFP